MRIIRNIVDGDFRISEELHLLGMMNGSASVIEGGTFIVDGMLNGKLFVENGGTAELRGMINGDVINNGGQIDIFGTVNGTVHEQAGVTLIHPGACVRG